MPEKNMNIPLVLVDGEYVEAPVSSDPTEVFGEAPTFSEKNDFETQGFTTKREELSLPLARAIPPIVEWRSPQAIEQRDLPDGPAWSA